MQEMPIRKDEEFIKKTHKEFYSQQAPNRFVVKLPCKCGVNIELSRPQDQYVGCPKCLKQFLYKHTMRPQGRKMYESG